MKELFGVFAGLTLTMVAIFVGIPDAAGLLGFTGRASLENELWRVLTFPLVHNSSLHLFENIVALFVMVLLAYEFELFSPMLLFLFFGTSFIIATTGTLLFPDLLLVGASVGVYGIFGALTVKGREWIPIPMLATLVGIVILLNLAYMVMSAQAYIQSGYHLGGFVVGAGIFMIK